MHLQYQSLGSEGGLIAVLSSPDAAGASEGTPQSELESALTERDQTTVAQPEWTSLVTQGGAPVAAA